MIGPSVPVAAPAADADGTAAWPGLGHPGLATGIGSMPGTDVGVVQRQLMDALPDFPHLVELPDRGPGADMIGRSAAILVDLPVDLQPAGWRFVDRPGRDVRRAADLLDRDLDTLGAAADGFTGPLKLQVAGPWTLAATMELQRGDKAIRDPGAVADIAASLAEGIAAQVVRVRGLVPGAQLTVQFDEPSLPAVLAGHLLTASGFGALRTPEPHEVQARLAEVLAAVPSPGVHCCARQVPFALLRASGAQWISFDATLLDPVREDDALGEALEAGVGLVVGVGSDPSVATALARRLALAPGIWLRGVVLAPSCGLAGASPPAAWAALAEVRTAARRLAESIEETA